MLDLISKEVLTIGAPILRERAEAVVNFASDELRNLVNVLFQKQDEAGGIGIAAPQIGVSKRVLVYGINKPNPRYPDVGLIPNTVIINPEIIWSSEDTSERCEGCLSVPNQRIPIERPNKIKLLYQNINGEKFEKDYEGFEARIIQHETDHLNGILIVDRAKEGVLNSLNDFELKAQ